MLPDCAGLQELDLISCHVGLHLGVIHQSLQADANGYQPGRLPDCFMFCLFRYKCCGATAELQRSGCSPRYSCCLREVDRLGCRKVCKKCGRDWGSPALDCFRKDHELVDINLPPTASPTTAATSQASSPPTVEDSLLSRPPSVAGGLSGQLKPSYRHSAPQSSSSFLPNITYHII